MTTEATGLADLGSGVVRGGGGRGGKTLNWFAPIVAGLVLVSMWWWEASLPDSAAGLAYLARVRELVEKFDKEQLVVGDWQGVGIPMPEEAIAALHANSVVSRAYVNVKTKEEASILFIQVEDSRDMMGHYPPNCYPGNGWVEQMELRAVHDGKPGHLPAWTVDGRTIPGVEYTFKRQEKGVEQTKVVRNFFVLPSGQIFPEMDSFWRPAMSFANRPFGAAQMQVCFDREYLLEDRDRIFESMLVAHRVLLDAVSHK